MEFEELGLPGAFVVRPRVLTDARGGFIKTFHEPSFVDRGLRTDWREEYQSSSRRGVIRGMHFQAPPADHAKLVFCLSGAVLDVIVDLRRGSPTYGEHRSVRLDAEQGTGVYVPTGCAHGFLSLSDAGTMYYKVTSVHAPDHDGGVDWSSIGFAWPVTDPLLSDRDRTHPPLAGFASPFTYDASAPSR